MHVVFSHTGKILEMFTLLNHKNCLESLSVGWLCRSHPLDARLPWLDSAQSLLNRLTVKSFRMFSGPTEEGRERYLLVQMEKVYIFKVFVTSVMRTLSYKNKEFFIMWIWGLGLHSISKMKSSTTNELFYHYSLPFSHKTILIIMLSLVKFGAADCFRALYKLFCHKCIPFSF